MFKRIFFFLALNIVVMLTLSVVMSLLGVQPYLTQYGLNYESLAVFCLIWGMGGSFISLAISRWMAKTMMGVKVVDASHPDFRVREIVETVHTLSRAAGLSVMPEVGIYESPEVNAFATGPTRNRSLVAVSTGIMQRMNKDELEGVLAHEVSHIANGDMVTMTLLQGIINAFVMFLARIIAFAIANAGRGNDRDSRVSTGMSYHITVFVLESVLFIGGALIMAAFSRYREYRADGGSAHLAGKEKMILALKKLQSTFELVDTEAQPAVQSMKISSRPGGIFKLFSTHPLLADRIARLEATA